MRKLIAAAVLAIAITGAGFAFTGDSAQASGCTPPTTWNNTFSHGTSILPTCWH